MCAGIACRIRCSMRADEYIAVGAAGQPNSIGGSGGAGGWRRDSKRRGLRGEFLLAPGRQNFFRVAIGLLAAFEHEIACGLERYVALGITAHRLVRGVAGVLAV